jgi:hypothetical protein
LHRPRAHKANQIVSRWLPTGRREGAEWIALNPTRGDAKPGTFKINLRSGSWADFATGDRGGDLVSLAAYLFRLKQADAAFRVAGMLGLNPYE